MEDLGLGPIEYDPGTIEYAQEVKRRKGLVRKQKLGKAWKSICGFFEKVFLGLVIVVIIGTFMTFFVWLYQDSNREAVEVKHEGIVKKSEMVFLPAHLDKGNEVPARMVNCLEVWCPEDSTTYKWNPSYLNEFMQDGDTVTVSTYHSKLMNLNSDKIRYRWDGELYE